MLVEGVEIGGEKGRGGYGQLMVISSPASMSWDAKAFCERVAGSNLTWELFATMSVSVL